MQSNNKAAPVVVVENMSYRLPSLRKRGKMWHSLISSLCCLYSTNSKLSAFIRSLLAPCKYKALRTDNKIIAGSTLTSNRRTIL